MYIAIFYIGIYVYNYYYDNNSTVIIIIIRVCGFFLLEGFLVTSNVGILSINETAKMWDKIMDSISATVYSYIRTLNNTKILLGFFQLENLIFIVHI